MPKSKKKRTPKPAKPWSPADVKTLRQLAGKQPRARIAKALKRSEAAVTFKAFKLRVSLAQKNRTRRKTTRKAR